MNLMKHPVLPFRWAPSGRFNPAITAIVVLVWLVLMGILLKDRYFPSRIPLSESVQISATESDDWFLVRIGGAYSGFGRSRQVRREGGWKLLDELNISLNIQGQLKPVRIMNESDVDGEFHLERFELKIASGLISFDVRGRMDGRDLIIETPGSKGSAQRKLKLYETPRIARSLGLPVPLTGLKVGDEIKLPIFDPLDGQKWDAVINVLEKADIEMNASKVEAWRVRAIFRSMEATLWIDSEGRLIKGRMPLGITVIRSDKTEIAREMKGLRELPDMVSLTSVPVEGKIPDNPDLQTLRLKVEGRGDWHIPSDGFRQKFEGSEITITRETIPQATYALPDNDERMKQFLAASPFIRSDHPDIIAKAREIVGTQTDPVKAAKLINTWVYTNLKKVPTPAVPDAHTVLVNLQGDCNEHAILAVALARAVGLPARVAVGLVYSGDGFYYHAWVNYWAGKTWFSGDPLLDELPASTTHVALLYGDVDKHVNVIGFLGRLTLKVVEAK